MSIEYHLNRLFAGSAKPKRKPAVHVVNGVTIAKVGKLWTAKLPDGGMLQSTNLGDLKWSVEQQTKGAR